VAPGAAGSKLALALAVLLAASGAQAAIAFRSASTTSNPTACIASFNFNAPSGVASTDVVIGVLISDTAISSFSSPAGWTLANTTIGNNFNVFTYWALGSVNFSNSFSPLGGSGMAAGYAVAYTGVDNTTPMDATAVGQSNADGTTITAPSITTVTANAMLFGAFVWGKTVGGTPSWSAFFGTERNSSGCAAGTSCSGWDDSLVLSCNATAAWQDSAEATQASPGVSGAKTVTVSTATSGGNMGVLVALRPASAGAAATPERTKMGVGQ